MFGVSKIIKIDNNIERYLSTKYYVIWALNIINSILERFLKHHVTLKTFKLLYYCVTVLMFYKQMQHLWVEETSLKNI